MLHDSAGNRKYLTSTERRAFFAAALNAQTETCTFALALAYSGARISEVLATTPRRIDFSVQGIVIRSLKRRRNDVFRTVPVPAELLDRLDSVHGIRAKQRDPALMDKPIWDWSRTTAWQRIKELMRLAEVRGAHATPKALRHAFAVEGTAEAGIPLNVMQKWMGHARIETTAIYANAVGREERMLMEKMWKRF